MTENKSKTGAIVLGVSSVLLVGVAIFFVVKALKTKGKQPQQSGGQQGGGLQGTQGGVQDGGVQGGTTTTTTTSSSGNPFDAIRNQFKDLFSKGGTLDTFTGWKFPIRSGQKNSSVEQLQLLLLKYDNRLLPLKGADGYFGSETQNALVKVLGKTKVTSQADIDAIKDKISTKAGQIAGNFAINQSLGLRIF